MKNLGAQLGQSEAEFIKVRDRQQAWLMEMPNLALPEVTVGADENENVESISMTLVMPNGTELNFASGSEPDVYTSVSGYSQFKPAAREGLFVLRNPAGGDYTVTVENEQELGNFTVEVLAMNHPAEVDIISVEAAGSENEYEVKWQVSDPDDSASVYVYVDSNREAGGGFIIGAYPEDDEIDSHTGLRGIDSRTRTDRTGGYPLGWTYRRLPYHLCHARYDTRAIDPYHLLQRLRRRAGQ